MLRDGSPRLGGPPPRFAWSRSGLAIAEAILASEWPRGIGTGALARATDWSPSQVSDVLQMFDTQGWTEKFGPQRGRGARRELTDPGALLDAWARETAEETYPTRLGHRLEGDLDAFFRSTLSEALDRRVRWAATGWIASSLVAPFATHIPMLQIYVAEAEFFGPLSKVMQNTGLTEVAEGGRIEFRSAPLHVLAHRTEVESLPVAAAPRIYADLLGLGGRAEDVAQHVRDEAIDPLHRPFSGGQPTTALTKWEAASRRRAHVKSGKVRLGLLLSGTWTVAYRLATTSAPPSPRRLLTLLRENVGHETDWPLWNARLGEPRVVDETIEDWRAETSTTEAGSADFWRARPDGFFFTLRGYQEDTEIAGLPAATALDLTLPIWRIAESLLHAARMADALGAPRIETHGAMGRPKRPEIRLGAEPRADPCAHACD